MGLGYVWDLAGPGYACEAVSSSIDLNLPRTMTHLRVSW